MMADGGPSNINDGHHQFHHFSSDSLKEIYLNILNI
jgi:hypothetical protein